MKTTAKLVLLALTISLASCSKSSDDNTNPDASGNNNGQITGDWKVTYYFDSGKDETGDYTGYTFNFNDTGSLQAVSTSAAFTGTWSIGEKNDDNSNSSSRMVIMITGNKAMDDLQDNWVIEKMTGTEIWLKDDNASSNEMLRFGK
jgi:hypothetical protein